MNGAQDERARLVAQLAEYAVANGLHRLSLRPMAKAVGTSDRMLLYYFRDKADLLETVLTAAAGQLAAELTQAVPAEPRQSPAALFARTSELVATARVQRYMALWSEMSAAAGRGEQTVTRIAQQIVAAFVDWAEQRLDVDDPARRRSLAALLLVMMDGGALLEPFESGAITRDAQMALVELLKRDRQG